MQLGFLPRLHVMHTSEKESGQIYLPGVNRVLLIGVVLAVIGFGSATALASAYGIAVTVTMLITTLLTFFVVRHVWRYPLPLALAVTGVFIFGDVVLVVSCSLKFWQGGWFPLVLGAGIFGVMATWKRGRELLLEHIRQDDPELLPFITAIAEDEHALRVGRTAVLCHREPGDRAAGAASQSQAQPGAARAQRDPHRRLPRRAWIAHEQRVEGRFAGARLLAGWKVNYGFKNTPDVPRALELCAEHGLAINLFETSYFLSRETVVPSPGSGMAHWRETLFAAMARNAGSAVEFLKLHQQQRDRARDARADLTIASAMPTGAVRSSRRRHPIGPPPRALRDHVHSRPRQAERTHQRTGAGG